MSVCRSNPDAPWDALALLDQYQRRGRIDAALARTLKTDIAQLVFGNANQTGAPPRDPTEATLDTTGSRWRKLIAENELADSGRRAAVRRSHAVPPRLRSGDASAAAAKMREEAQAQRAGRSAQAGRPRPPRGDAEGRAARSLRAVVDPRPRQQRHRLQGARSASRASRGRRALRRGKGAQARLSATGRRRSPRWSASFTRRSRCRIRTSSACSTWTRTATRISSSWSCSRASCSPTSCQRLRGPMQRQHALAIISSVGAALAHAHRRDIVHADLKPRNIMITSTAKCACSISVSRGTVRSICTPPRRSMPRRPARPLMRASSA